MNSRRADLFDASTRTAAAAARALLSTFGPIRMSTAYSRTSPSPRYRELLAHYSDMHHVAGERFQNVSAAKTYPGDSMPRHAGEIKAMIDAHAARTILDYGSGKGCQYQQMSR